MPQLSLFLLGTFQADLNNEPVTGFQSDKARALLAYLAVESAQAHRRDRLAGLLWSDYPERNARANLRHALNNLRTILRDRQASPPFFFSDRQIIQFNPDSSYRLDVAEFRRQFQGLAKIESASAAGHTIERLQQAVALYTGPFLSGFFLDDCSAFEEWTLLTRERLQNRMLAALRSLTAHLEQQERYKEALRYARRWVELDALQEAAHRQVMRLLALDGQRGAALVQYETCRQLLESELGVTPGAETIALHRQIQTSQLASPTEVTLETSLFPKPAAPPPHNLPAQTTRFIGRSVELAAVREKLLQPEVRLLTLTGPGGTGKTRLSLQIAAALLDQFADGVFFVPLAPLRDPDLVGSTLAETLGVRESGGRSVVGLLKEHVQDKELLLLLDNFEHITPAASLVSDLLVAAPRLKILVTSRTLLRLYGEYHYPVPPLSLPDLTRPSDPDQLLAHEACQLFVDRAQTIKPRFALTHDNAPAVAGICAKLDGLPLAIELAAARVRLLPPQKILVQLRNRLQFLTRGHRDLPDRHQTLRNTIAWSYDLLEPKEQFLFQRLAVFAGSFSLEAAEAIGNVSGDIDAFYGLESLIDKSLLRQVDVAGEPRFEMLGTIRDYGLERLRASGETDFILRSCVDFYLGWIREMNQTAAHGDQGAWLAQLESEHDNLRAVLHWARDNEETEIGLKLVGVLWRFWEMRGYFSEGRRHLEEVLQDSEAVDPALRAEAYTGVGTMAWYQNNYSQALVYHQAALALYRELGDEQGIAFALNNVGCQACDQGDYDEAARYFRESIVLAQKLDDLGQLENRFILSYAIHNLGEVARHQANYQQATALYEEALALFRELGDFWAVARQLAILGTVKQRLGDYDQAAVHFKESLIHGHRLNNKECIAGALEGYASLAMAQAQPERAVRLWGAAELLRESIGVPLHLAEKEEYDHTVVLAYDTLGQTAFAAAWKAGRSMSLEQAIDFALGQSPG